MKALFFAFFIILATRYSFWHHHGGLLLKDNSPDIDDYLKISQMIFRGANQHDWNWFWDYRPTQILYPILLSPIHLFHLDANGYVFAMHLFAACLMVYMAYLIGEEICGNGGICAVFTALNPFPIMFFNWMLTDTVYYALLFVFVLESIKAWQSKSNNTVPMAIVLLLLKPEAIAPVTASFLFYAYHHNRRLIVVTAVFPVMFVALMFNANFRNKVLSHTHIAHGLWLSTRTWANPHGLEQTRAYTNMPDVTKLEMSKDGITYIKERPHFYIARAVVRFTAVLFPWAYRGWEGFWTMKEIVITMFTFLGFLYYVFLCPYNIPSRGIFWTTLSMLVFVSFYVNDGNLRFRVPIQNMMFLLSPLGWSNLRKRF